MEERGGYLRNRAVKVFGAKVDFPVKLVIRIPDFMDTAPAVCATPAVWGYGDGWAGKFFVVEMLIEQVKHFFGFLYDFGYLKHCCVLLKIMF